MVNLPKDKCSACSACASVCHAGAIVIKEDIHGFMYPVVDTDKCTHCNACDKVCPELNLPLLSEPLKTFAAKAAAEQLLETVASGGLASILAADVIMRGGIVYGCAMNSIQDIRHIRCTEISHLEQIKNSKYVQSSLGDTFCCVKKDLTDGKEVLFIGTPCQVGGLKNSLRKQYPNLITVDLICHGVPSQDILRDYVHSQIDTSVHKDENIRVDFRWKVHAKSNRTRFGIRIIDKANRFKKTITIPKCSYMAAFFSGISYRENCHNCRYARVERVSDITLGDFWGLENLDSAISARDGVSMVLVNTEKGMAIFNRVKGSIISEEHRIEDAKKFNNNLNHPTTRPENKHRFIETYHEEGVDRAVKKFVPSYNRENAISHRIYLFVAQTISKVIKSIR